MRGIRQATYHMTNIEQYKKADQQPIRTIIRARQLKFAGHSFQMVRNESANIYVHYKPNTNSNKPGSPPKNFVDQITTYITRDKQEKMSLDEISKNKSKCPPDANDKFSEKPHWAVLEPCFFTTLLNRFKSSHWDDLIKCIICYKALYLKLRIDDY